MKITHHAGKGGQRIFPGRGALNDIVKKRPSINNYAKAAPGIAQTGPNIFGKDPAGE